MPYQNSPRVRLSDLQFDVMRVLWQGDASVADVVEALQASRDLAHTTVATVLSRLERVGIVACDRDGRALRYRACISEHSVRHSMVNELLDTVFQGDADALLALVADERRLPSADSGSDDAAASADESEDSSTKRRQR